jgi:hypothetical protein
MKAARQQGGKAESGCFRAWCGYHSVRYLYFTSAVTAHDVFAGKPNADGADGAGSWRRSCWLAASSNSSLVYSMYIRRHSTYLPGTLLCIVLCSAPRRTKTPPESGIIASKHPRLLSRPVGPSKRYRGPPCCAATVTASVLFCTVLGLLFF